MTKFIVSYGTGWKNDNSQPETIEADYYKFEDAWILFKDEAHKTKVAVKSSAVMSIRLE